MALAGTLRDFSLADIFQLIGLQKKAGILTLTNASEEARILFMNGMVVGADTNNQKLENHLGHVLVKSNRISQGELDQVLTIQSKTLQRLGQVLIQKGFIKQDDLIESLQTQTTQIIYRLFRWTDGEYHFQQQPYVDYDQENFRPITSESILMEGVRMLDEWPMIEKVIPTFEVVVERTNRGKAIRLHVENDFTLDTSLGESFNSLLKGVMGEGTESGGGQEDEQLNQQQELVLKLIEGPSVVQDLIDSSGMNEFETCRALYDLMGMGLVKRVTAHSSESGIKLVEEHQIPKWIPAALIVVIALFSFLLGWNPVNRLVPTPASLSKSPFQFMPTSLFRLDRIAEAIDLFYVKNGRLPLNLGTLITENFLELETLRDPKGRTFTYEVLINENKYTLFGLDAEGQRQPSLTREKAFPMDGSNLDL